MSWGSGASGAASGAASAAEGASSAGSAASSAGSAAGSGASIYGQMADVGGTSATPATQGAGGFSIDAGATSQGASTQGPTMQNAADVQTLDNLKEYGTENPSMWDKGVKGLENFQKGRENSLGDAWKNRGWNAETAGYMQGKLGSLSGIGKGGGTQANFTTNITNQQPRNEYLEKRRYN